MIKAGFVDFWPGFEAENLFFARRLRNEGIIEFESDLSKCALLFCGVFNSYRLEGQESQKYPNAARFLVASESFVNHPIFPKNNFKYGVCGDKNVPNLRHLPYAAYEFNLPAEVGTLVDKYHWDALPLTTSVIKSKFCGFCASNGEIEAYYGVRLRDAFFKMLNSYKHVDSFGAHLNNMPDGERAPRVGYSKYLSAYKFMICFENAQGPGYMTEKPVQCFVAQTVPIYWGESSGLLNPEACIIVDPNNMHDAIQRVLQLDADDEAYAHMLKMGQTKPFMDKKPFDRNACYTYVKKIIVDEIAHPAIPPVIILSLKRRSEERRQAVLQECARVGFNSVSVFDAIDGSNIDEWALKQSLAGVLDPAAALTPGQLGCLASHVAIWRSLKSNGWTIVIEDDCRFHPNFTHEKLQELVKSIPAQAMMLRLAYLAAGPFAAHIGPVVNNWRQLSGPVFSTVAYAVHNSIIPLLLSYARKQPVDCQLPWGKCVYGAASLNSLPSFYEYDNPVIKTKETFYGIASVPHQLKSDTI